MVGHPQLRSLLVSIAPVFVLILILSAGVKLDAQPTLSDNLYKAVAYLRSTAYNPDVRLCREAPRVAPNVYWVTSDNLLAFKALEPYDSSLASTIGLELVRIAKFYNLPVFQDGLPLSLRYDVIMRDDAVLEMPPRDVSHVTLYNSSYLLRYDIANATESFDDWRDFADLDLLVALSNHNRGDNANAAGNFTEAANMWDGMGLRDKAYRLSYGEGQAQGTPNAYATYKLGLLLYVSGKLGIRLPFEQDVVNRIWLMQNSTSGGIFTHILPDGGHGDSDTNTETTALVILGVTIIHPQALASPSPLYDRDLVTMLATVALLVVICSVVFTIWRRKQV